MSQTAQDTPNAWRTGHWKTDEDESIERAIKRLSRKLERAPSSLVTRINKMNRENRFRIWESE